MSLPLPDLVSNKQAIGFLIEHDPEVLPLRLFWGTLSVKMKSKPLNVKSGVVINPCLFAMLMSDKHFHLTVHQRMTG